MLCVHYWLVDLNNIKAKSITWLNLAFLPEWFISFLMNNDKGLYYIPHSFTETGHASSAYASYTYSLHNTINRTWCGAKVCDCLTFHTPDGNQVPETHSDD